MKQDTSESITDERIAIYAQRGTTEASSFDLGSAHASFDSLDD